MNDFQYTAKLSVQFSSVQLLSRVQHFATPWIAARQASLSITNSWSLLKLMPIELVMPSSHLILCCPLLLLPSIHLNIRVFPNESTLRMRWPKYWSFSFSISPSNEHPGLISFRMDWLGLLAVQGTLKSLLQHNSSKASVFLLSAWDIGHSQQQHLLTQISSQRLSNFYTLWVWELKASWNSGVLLLRKRNLAHSPMPHSASQGYQLLLLKSHVSHVSYRNP